jgi:hypothetical protein
VLMKHGSKDLYKNIVSFWSGNHTQQVDSSQKKKNASNGVKSIESCVSNKRLL